MALPPPTTMPTELLAHRLAAMPTKQLEALRRAIDATHAQAVTLMSWLSDLVSWENARRRSQKAPPALPRLGALDVDKSVLTLSVLATFFQMSIANGAIQLQPTVDLLDAVRQALLFYASGEQARWQ